MDYAWECVMDGAGLGYNDDHPFRHERHCDITIIFRGEAETVPLPVLMVEVGWRAYMEFALQRSKTRGNQ